MGAAFFDRPPVTAPRYVFRPPFTGAEDHLQGLGEVAGADALEVQPGDQPLQAPGLLQVRRQDRRGERLPLVGGAAVSDPRLLDLDGSDAGLDRPAGQGAVADDLAVSPFVPDLGVGVDPGGDLGPDGLGQEPLGSLPEDVREDVLALGQGHDAVGGGRLGHGGVLLGLVGQLVCS